MFKVPLSYRLPLGVSIILHLLLFVILIIKLPKTETYGISRSSHEIKIINAVAINQSQVNEQINAIKRQEQQKHARELARLNQLKQQALAAKRKRIQEQHHLARLEAQQLRLKNARIARAKALALKKKQQQIAKQKAAQQQAKALATKQEQLQQQLMQQQIQQDQQQLAKARAAQMQRILDQYKAQIIQAIQQQWIVPASANKNLSCMLLIHLAPGGVVLSARILRSSSDAVFDRSARVAVFKASPLPVPKDPSIFNKFRDLHLTVRPEHITSG